MAENTPPTDAASAVPQPERIEDLRIEQELQDSYLTYAMSTNMDRALPDVRDGLKPSQRRILVAMNDLGLGPRSKHRKCAKIAGDTSGNYHPHGEAVIYPTLVRMAQDWSMRHTLIDGQGNFGSTDGDPPAAMRYTEARMAWPTMDMMADLDLDTVDFQPNYDERLLEPLVLPSKFPNLLVNGSTGIAVGMACNLLPHNLREICDAIDSMIVLRMIPYGSSEITTIGRWPLPCSSTSTLARRQILPRPVRYPSTIPSRPQIVPPVGKSGPGTISSSSWRVTSGLSITFTIASQISRRLCGSRLHAMPTAMPVEPLTSRLGNLPGRTVGSMSRSS